MSELCRFENKAAVRYIELDVRKMDNTIPTVEKL